MSSQAVPRDPVRRTCWKRTRRLQPSKPCLSVGDLGYSKSKRANLPIGAGDPVSQPVAPSAVIRVFGGAERKNVLASAPVLEQCCREACPSIWLMRDDFINLSKPSSLTFRHARLTRQVRHIGI